MEKAAKALATLLFLVSCFYKTGGKVGVISVEKNGVFLKKAVKIPNICAFL
ncbi:MAG: hypothetical protein IJW22_03855 [Clostridia bacterium]|nr:hypothetical protein [Clostridia bacterium]